MSKLSSTPSLPPSLFSFLLFLLLIFQSFSVHSQTTEQQILLDLKQQWKTSSFLNSSWDPSIQPDHCNWTGVLCSNTGSVTDLNLFDINITEQIPQSICNLKNLTYLDLSYNSIPGQFPTLLYNCSNLRYLNLSQNYLVGRIPVDIDRISINLMDLNLAANNFSGDIPTSIANLPSLQVLDLSMNLFNGSFPPQVGNLSNLMELTLAFNPFQMWKIPTDFGRLNKLQMLWMEETSLTGEIPDIFSNLTGLQHLNLKTNNFSGEIPASLFKLKNLTKLYLYKNKLSGQIPTAVESLSLSDLDLSANQFTGTIPEDFGKLQRLEYLLLYANRLTGEIPASIGRLQSLIELRLFNNNLSGILPPELGLHSMLETLEVGNNHLNGNLPENLCAAGVFVGVTAFLNNLTGGLPSSFKSCDSLQSVQLYNNNFSGEVPNWFWSLKNLSTVMVSNNLFSGVLPDKLSWNLSRLEMSNNRFSGKISSKIMSSTNLTVFEASNNLFYGEIPSELTALSQLLKLVLDRNQLSGDIPEIISWKSLTTLNLSRNQLSGEIPSELGSLPTLNELDLSNNQFVGEIPLEITKLRLNFLNLSSNKLTGTIPTDFDNLAYEESFLNNTGLCATNTALNLSSCFSERQHSKKSSPRFLIMVIFLSVAISIFVILLILYVVKDYQRRKRRNDLSSWKLTSFQRLDFTESNILSNLTENNLIGSGSSGEVYRVSVSCSGTYVAVKKIWSKGKLDQNLEKEFLAEVQILGTIRHSNIVKLLCCISNEKSKFLVYEYMENRSLDLWLHGKKSASLPFGSVHHLMLDWPKRMEIAIGVAQGLCYMHHSCTPPIIHRDVKSSNILLDSEFNAKIADFGLARMLHKQGELNTMSVIAGSYGYIAPEYAHTAKVNEKIDVYSFGVVLLELVTGKEAKDGGDHTCLAEQAWSHFQDGNPIENALDEEVKEPGNLEEMCTIFRLGLMCTATLPSTRPSMKEVLAILFWRGPLQAWSEKKAQNENDVAPLLNATKEGRGSHKSSQQRKTSDEDELSGLACNV